MTFRESTEKITEQLMAAGHRFYHLSEAVVVALACAEVVAACGSSSHSSSSSGGTPTPTPSQTSPVASSALPNSCSAIPASLIGPYIGGVATTQTLATSNAPVFGFTSWVSCAFANATSSNVVVVSIGQGNASSFATLQSATACCGRTITPINGLGTAAFAVTTSGTPNGAVNAVTADYVVFVVAALTIDQDEAMIRQLMQLY